MGIVNNALAGASGNRGYFIQRSLRFRSSASAYLSKTYGSTPTNLTKQTYSFWVKRGQLSNSFFLFSGYVSGSSGTKIYFDSSDKLHIEGIGSSISTGIATTAVYRDPSAWYHVVVSVDTTQATSTNRILVYVNGVQVTSFSSTQYPNQNDTSQFAASGVQSTVGTLYSPAGYFDGYLAEVNFIDGQALTPSSFGQTDPLTGVWTPKKYTGTYGTNGFYLDFKDNTSATTLAYDKSGNGNNWTPNNISTTAGATYDSMTDVPTLTSTTAANFAVMNPVVPSSGALSSGNLNFYNNGSVTNSARGTIGVTAGKWYWEVSDFAGTPTNGYIGIGNASAPVGADPYLNANVWAYYGYNGYKVNTSATAYGATFTSGDVIGIAFDADNGTLTYYKNGTSQGTAFTGLTTGPYFPFFNMSVNTPAASLVANFGQRPFSYTPPTGFKALNTFNLPEPSIKQGSSNFNVVLDTGANIKTAVEAVYADQALMVVKDRANANNWQWFNDLVDTSSILQSNTTAAETTYSAPSGNSAGFVWKAGGTGVTNIAGTITSTVSANTTAGFSIVTYTGTGANATVGHGLGVAPKFFMVKTRTGGIENWYGQHTSLTSGTYYLMLNLPFAQINDSTRFTAFPTYTVLNLGANSAANGSGYTYVAYCFAEIADFSKFGSYTGNGSTDGPFVYCGFRPKYVMMKGSSVASHWIVYDTARNTYNVVNNELSPNNSSAENGVISSGDNFDIVSNGFKIRSVVTNDMNVSGQTYIYAAFAENPFKYSLAR